VFVNQWSVVHGVPASAGRYKYMADVAKELQVSSVPTFGQNLGCTTV
jgi:hypothetical protein